MSESSQVIRLEMFSSFEVLDLVQVLSDRMSALAGFDDDATHWVSVAVRESVINAIKHGNCNDVRKRVHVEFTSLQDGGGPGLAVRVRFERHGDVHLPLFAPDRPS